MNWREFPFLRLLWPFMVGILLAFYAIPYLTFLRFPFLLISLFVVLLVLARPRRSFSGRWYFGLVASLFFLTFGYQLCWWQNDWHQEKHFRHFLKEEPDILIGEVHSLERKNDHWKAQVQVEGVEEGEQGFLPCTGKLLVRIPWEDFPDLGVGTRLLIHSKIFPIKPPANPASFDFSHFMRIRNIYFQSFPKAADIKILETNGAKRLSYRIKRQQKRGVQTLQQYLPDEDAFAVGAALILGHREGLDPELKESYSQTGAMHVLAVSGLHVGMISFFLAFVLSRIPLKGWYLSWGRLALQLTGIWGFALLTGASPSVLRAATMFSLLMLGMHLQRYTNIYNTLAASAFLLLSIRPLMLLELGFQLSYLAVIGIVYFQPRIYKTIFIRPAWARFFWKLLAVSLAAQITTLPISLYYFHQFPTYFWLSGLIVVPAAMIILPMGILLLFCSVMPSLAEFIGGVLGKIIGSVNFLIEGIQQLPAHLISGIWIGLGTTILLYFFVFSVVLRLETKKLTWLWAGSFLLLLIGAQNTFLSWQSVAQKQVVFYQVFKHTAIDFIDGKKSIALLDPDLEQTKFERLSQTYLWSRRSKRSLTHRMDKEVISNNNYLYVPNFAQFYDTRMAIVDKPLSELLKYPVKVDYVLVRGNPKLDMEKMKELFNPKQIIFDASNPQWSVKNWKRECQALDLPYYDLQEEGALIIDVGEKSEGETSEVRLKVY